jgi:cyclopropane fatty-acyl-phospholipid synthase-like methyltransferase
MIKKIIAKQFRKPFGLLGFMASKLMDKGNLQTINWIFSLLDPKENENILEIGYGSGILLNKLANLNINLKLSGIDFSKLMYKRAIKTNKEFIQNKVLKLSHGDILNYNEDVLFDKIVAINVIYFWDDINKYITKINSILNKSGKIYLYMTDPKELVKIKFTTTNIFNKYTIDYVINELNKFNFTKVSYEIGKTNVAKAYCIIIEK